MTSNNTQHTQGRMTSGHGGPSTPLGSERLTGGPRYKRRSVLNSNKRRSRVTAALESLTEVPDQAPFDLQLEDGSVVTIREDMVERRRETVSETGEWYIPHVVEPAFGIDRIIWHILDHSYHESEKEGGGIHHNAAATIDCTLRCCCSPSVR